MIVELILSLFKTLGVVAILCILRAVWIEIKVRLVLRRLLAQGMSDYPGNDIFMVGPTVKNDDLYNELMKGEDPIQNRFQFALNILSEGDR